MDPDQAQLLLGLTWVQSVCKGYEQMKLGKKYRFLITNLHGWRCKCDCSIDIAMIHHLGSRRLHLKDVLLFRDTLGYHWFHSEHNITGDLLVVGDLKSCHCLSANNHIIEDKLPFFFCIYTAALELQEI